MLAYELFSWVGLAVAAVLGLFFSAWLGRWAVERQWERWRREHPVRPWNQWQDEPS